ncbi:epidermal retinol dehydrogenase 2-like [Glandiceps talaboti]
MYIWILVLVIIFLAWTKLSRPKLRKSIEGEVTLVTGAGGDIGRQLAIAFAKQGARVVLWDINKESNDETAQQIGQIGGKAHSYVCDVTKKEEVYRVAEQVTKDVGNVTILVNNAGVLSGKKLIEIPDSMIERTMKVNTMAIFWTVKAFMPSMISRNHGHLVTIASIAGSAGCPGLSDYCASKHAAVGLHESLALELAAQGMTGIHTTLVQPNWVDTGMIKGARTGRIPVLQPEGVADRVMDAVLVNRRSIFLPGVMALTPYLKSWMPVDAWLWFAKCSGSFNAMDTLIGRQ